MSEYDIFPPPLTALQRASKRASIVLLTLGLAGLIFAMFGCAAAEERAPSAPASRPESAPTSRRSPIVSEWAFCAWADAQSRALERRFGTRCPESILQPFDTPCSGIVSVGGFDVIAIYTLGRYHRDHELIEVWAFDEQGAPIPADEIRHTWLHEWLHHFDKVNGIPPPTGAHNDAFDLRLCELGLWPD